MASPFFPHGRKPLINVEEGRSQELENLVGNYMITDFQRRRLEEKIHEHVTDWRHNPSSSTTMFKFGKKWFRIDLNVVDVTPTEPEESTTEPVEKEETESETTHFP